MFCLLSSLELIAQDKIFLKSGDTLHVIISQRDDKLVNYTSYDDPEFNTQSISTDLITKIQLDNGKIINFAKSKYPGFYVGIYFGNAIPISDFSQDNPDDSRSGFARDKPFLSIEARMRVFRFIGVQADISAGTFGVNSTPYFEYLNQLYRPQFTTVSGTLSDYRYSSFSIGPDLGFNVGKRMKVFLPIQLSFINLASKGKDVIEYEEQFSIHSSMERETHGNGVGLAFGAKVDFVIAKHFGLGISVKANDYAVTRKVQEVYSKDNVTINYSWTQNVTYLYTGINLHYHFK